MSHPRDDSFVFDTVDLLNLAFTVVPSYTDEMGATTDLGDERLGTGWVDVDITTTDNVSYLKTF